MRAAGLLVQVRIRALDSQGSTTAPFLQPIRPTAHIKRRLGEGRVLCGRLRCGRMNVMSRHALAILMGAVVLIGGCKDAAQPMEHVLDTTTIAPRPDGGDAAGGSPLLDEASGGAISDAGHIPIPRRWQLPTLSEVESADSWGNRLAELPASDQEWLRLLNDRYGGSLAFASPEEQQWLIQQGFPMPEEWLAGRRLHETELEQLAERGNLKAQMLFIDSVISEIGPVRASGSGLDNSQEDRKLLSRFARATSMVTLMMESTQSPFTAYLEGAVLSAGAQYNPPEYVASGIMLARDLGDRRAEELRQAYQRSHPGMDSNLVLNLYSSGKGSLHTKRDGP